VIDTVTGQSIEDLTQERGRQVILGGHRVVLPRPLDASPTTLAPAGHRLMMKGGDRTYRVWRQRVTTPPTRVDAWFGTGEQGAGR
jgi:hypothetical protein